MTDKVHIIFILIRPNVGRTAGWSAYEMVYKKIATLDRMTPMMNLLGSLFSLTIKM